MQKSNTKNAVLRAFRAFNRYHDSSSFRAWMFKILTNEIFSLNRKRGRIRKFEVSADLEEVEPLLSLEQACEYHEELLSPESLADALDENLLHALKGLTETERAVLLLRAIADLRYREISDSLDIPLGSVMGNLSRARQKMRVAITQQRRRTKL